MVLYQPMPKSILYLKSNTCHVCVSHAETWEHLFQCNNKLMITSKVYAVNKYCSAVMEAKTAPLLQSILLYKHVQFCVQPMSPPHKLSDEMRALLSTTLEEQNNFGWNNFAKGHISKLWGKAQHLHLQLFYPAPTYLTPKCWGKYLILAI
eukprot:4201673-Ditylum_brightwellii.AAC.2